MTDIIKPRNVSQLARLLALYSLQAANALDTDNIAALARRLGVSRPTIYRDLELIRLAKEAMPEQINRIRM